MQKEPQTTLDRALVLLKLLVPDRLVNWRLTTNQLVWIIRGLIVLGLLLALGAPYDKGLWDWLDLLVVPAVIAVGVFLLDQRQRARDQAAEAERQRRQEQELEEQRNRELQVEEQRAQDAALQTYIDKIGVMVEDYRILARQDQKAESEYQVAVLDYETAKDMPKSRPADWEGYWRNPDRAKENKEQKKVDRKTARDLLQDKRTLIRAQTLTVLERIGERHKRAVMRFLSEAGLLKKDGTMTIPLRDADFSGADLTQMNLSDNNLREVRLTRAKLVSADLRGTDLTEADLRRANLNKAVLGTARVSNVLRDGGVEPAPPHQAVVAAADLSYADLSEAAGIEERQLSAAKSLQGATMPDGSISD